MGGLPFNIRTEMSEVKNVNVIKRSGLRELYDVVKIKEAIGLACEGLDVNPLQLESKFDEFIFDGITTKQINQNLIHHAIILATPENPEWALVAGRLKTMGRWADTKNYELDFSEYVTEMMNIGEYTHPGLFAFSQPELEVLDAHLAPERDLNHSYASVSTAEGKYLQKNELIQHMFMANSMIIASVEPDDTKRLDFAKTVYDSLSNRKISQATPWLSNLRSNGNISSCFILEMDDNLNSIMDNIKRAATISKLGGGMGVFMGRVRALGSDLMGSEGKAGGVFGWIKFLNDVAVYVNQAGKRAGAITVALPIWHADIANFLDLQTEAGDPRKKCFDIKPQVCINDIFMRLKNNPDQDWHTFCPHEVEAVMGYKLYNIWGDEFEAAYESCVQAYKKGILKVVRVYKAKELWIKFLQVVVETGMPYVFWTDTVNRMNPNKHCGMIKCANLCVESFSNIEADVEAHTCNLASIVVGRVETLQDLINEARIATRILDNGIELTHPPVEISKFHNNKYRTIGVGIQGLHDIYAKFNKPYTDSAFAMQVAELIQYGCVLESIELAKERGSYPAFKGSMWDTGEMTRHFAKYSQLPPGTWEAVQEQIDMYGIRNSQLTSPAPNTSSSMFMDAAAGPMPVYAGFFYEDNKDGKAPVYAMYIKENPLNYSRGIGTYYPAELTKTIGGLQKFVDTGISAEFVVNMNLEGVDAKWMWDLYEASWLNENKCVYYVRTIKEGESVSGKEEVCAACSG